MENEMNEKTQQLINEYDEKLANLKRVYIERAQKPHTPWITKTITVEEIEFDIVIAHTTRGERFVIMCDDEKISTVTKMSRDFFCGHKSRHMSRKMIDCAQAEIKHFLNN
jgi:hypothetical protein